MVQPNVILIMCDQLRFDCLGYAGHPLVKTPHLDRLAENGVVFETAYCASPVCSPARASWLTGTYPHAHNQLANYGPQKIGMPGAMMNGDAITLGDLFKKDGYRCGMAGPWHLGNDHEPQHGFTDFWRAYRYQGDHPDLFFNYLDREGVTNVYEGAHESIQSCGLSYTPIEDVRQQRTTWTIEQGIEFLDGGDDRPFLLFLSVKDPHPLIAVTQELVDLYPIDEIELPHSWMDLLGGKPEYQVKEDGRLSLDTEVSDFKQMVAHYYALVTHIDAEVGRLVAHLENLGLGENTLLAFISDHGEMLGDLVSISSPIGTHIIQAVGAAKAFQQRGEDRVCFASFGDGGTSSLGFHSALNFAGVWKAPVVFSCQNNGYAISCPSSEQTGSESYAIKGEAYGVPGVKVDGNDIFAVRQAFTEAVDHARAGGGPTLIECVTFRMGGHSTSDDPTKYVPAELLEHWAKRDPIEIFERALTKAGKLTDAEKERIASEVEEVVVAAVATAEETPQPNLEEIFTDVYGEIPDHLRRQGELSFDLAKRKGDAAAGDGEFPL